LKHSASVADPCLVVAVQNIVIDKRGVGICLSVYNYTREVEFKKLPLKKGTILVLKEPYLKKSGGKDLSNR
jgi:hypothetical protein